MPNFIDIEETFCGRTDVQTDGHLRPTLLGRLGVDLKMSNFNNHLEVLMPTLYPWTDQVRKLIHRSNNSNET